MSESSRQIEVLMPYGESPADSGDRLAPRLSDLGGRVIGIGNNSWNCMNVLAGEYRRILLEELGVREVVEHRVAATVRLHPTMMDDLVARCDAVIVGIGN
jgi:hypothetical protein